MSLYIPKMSDTPAITIPGLAENFGILANHLNSMTIESGTFTPYLGDANGDIGNYTTQSGEYLRQGSLVFVRIFLSSTFDYTTTSGSGQLAIYGLPFVAVGSAAFSLYRFEGFLFPSGAGNMILASANPSSQMVIFRYSMTNNEFLFPRRNVISSAGFTLGVSGVYRIE